MIYADNAATTKLDPAALEAMLPFLAEDYANPSQPYAFSRASKRALKTARTTIAESIGAAPDEIYFTSGGTESDNWAIKGVDYTGRRRIITTAIEHHAVLDSCRAMTRWGCKLALLTPEPDGAITGSALKASLPRDSALVSIMLANNETGAVQPVRELADIAHANGALFHTDAVQAVGHIPVEVNALGVDMLSASAHKFNGPRGAGFLYVRKGTPLGPFHNGGAQERSMRAGTENVAAIAGMAKALEINRASLKETAARLLSYEAILVKALDGVEYRHNVARCHVPGNMSLSFRGVDGEALLHRMDLAGICISTGSACTSGRTGISHVLEAMGMPRIWAMGTVRVSLGRFNSEDEIYDIATALRTIVGQMQSHDI